MRPFVSRVRKWLPPVITQKIDRCSANKVRFEGNYTSWQVAESDSQGYDAKEILSRVLTASIKVKNGEAAYERDSITFEEGYVWPLLSGLMWAAARDCGKLNVLDYGGALGSSFFQNKKFLDTIPNMKWNIVEQAHYVEAGQEHIQSQHLSFYKTINECLKENQPNVILLSSVLQYIEAPYDLLEELSAVGAGCMVIDRSPFSSSGQDHLLVQKVPPAIYRASYPMWVFSLPKFVQATNASWNLLSQHTCPEGDATAESGLNFSFQGLLYEAKK